MLNVLLLSPGYPADMPEFTRSLSDYIPVRSL